MCRFSDGSKEFNLSQESLTSREAMQLLREVENNDKELWNELTKEPERMKYLGKTEQDPFEGDVEDVEDSSIPLEVVQQRLHSVNGAVVADGYRDKDGCLEELSDTEEWEFEEVADGSSDDSSDEFVQGSSNGQKHRRLM